MPTELFQRATLQRCITAVRRVVLPLRSDLIYDMDDIGAFEVPGEPRVVSRERAATERRARPRLSMPRFAPPAWRLHRRRFSELLSQGVPFGLLPPAIVHELASVASWVAVPKGGALFTEGTPLDSMYVVAQGSFALSRNVGGVDQSLGLARSGDALGLCSALGHYGALATARSRDGASVLRLPTACVVDAACQSKDFYAALTRIAEVRAHCHLLAASAFSDLLGPEGRAGAAGLFQRVLLHPRQALLLPGQVNAFVAVVESGQLALSTFGQGGVGPERVERTASRGQVLGCVSGLQGRPAAAAVRAIEPTVVSLLDQKALARLSLLHRGLAGLPALLQARGELTHGSFFAVDGVRTAAQQSWRARATALLAA